MDDLENDLMKHGFIKTLVSKSTLIPFIPNLQDDSFITELTLQIVSMVLWFIRSAKAGRSEVEELYRFISCVGSAPP
jgi:hypothetical protein